MVIFELESEKDCRIVDNCCLGICYIGWYMYSMCDKKTISNVTLQSACFLKAYGLCLNVWFNYDVDQQDTAGISSNIHTTKCCVRCSSEMWNPLAMVPRSSRAPSLCFGRMYWTWWSWASANMYKMRFSAPWRAQGGKLRKALFI